MEQQEQGSGKSEPGLVGAWTWFLVLWALALFLSCWHLHLQGGLVFGGGESPDTDLGNAFCVLAYTFSPPTADARGSHAAIVAGAAKQPAPVAGAPSFGEWFAQKCRPAYNRALAAMNKHLTTGLHPEQTLAGALLKIVVVSALSLLWFYTFLLADRVKRRYLQRRAADPAIKDAKQAAGKRRRVGFTAWGIKVGIALVALVPALIFSLSMYHAYEPAVFVMALVAVYVAAEHYGGLVQTEQELHERTEDLMSTMGTVLDADGLNFWRAELYALYLNATWRIDAVIRNFDIDLEWWKCATERSPWDHYVMRSAAKTGEYTLLHVMGASRAEVKFAVDLPLPMRAVSPECPEPEKSKFFRDLLGLAWYLVVFDLALKQRQVQAEPNQRIARLRIKLTHAPSWMHVVDYTVYQMIERSTLANSTVRQLTHGVSDPEDRRLLSRWAREDVSGFARRGGPAEEYVFSVLRYGAYKNHGKEDAPLVLREVLNKLGMQEYLDEPKEEFMIVPAGTPHAHEKTNLLLLERADAEKLCKAVFDRLIEIGLEREVRGVRLQDLIGEVL